MRLCNHEHESESQLDGDRNENVSNYSEALDPTRYHDNLDLISFSSLEDVSKYYLENIETVNGRFGVLLFLYSVILTRVSF